MFSQKHVEWFTTNYNSHTMSERNMEVKQTSFQESCLLCLWCVCVCVCVAVAAEMADRCSGRACISHGEIALPLKKRCPTATTTVLALPNGNDDWASLCLAQQREDVSLKPMMPWKTKTPGRQRQRYWQYFQLIEYLTCITYIIQHINTGTLSCFCVLVPALKICES